MTYDQKTPCSSSYGSSDTHATDGGSPGPAVAVAELYAAFARDLRNGTQDAPTFATALQLHRALADIERGAHWTPPVEVRSTP